MIIRLLLLITALVVQSISFAATSTPTQENAKAAPVKVLLIMSRYNSAAKSELLKTAAANQPFELVFLKNSNKNNQEIGQLWHNFDLVMLDSMSPELAKSIFGQYQGVAANLPQLQIISFGDLDNKEFNQNIANDQQQRLAQYFNNAGLGNYNNLMTYIANDVLNLGNIKAEPPVMVPLTGLYHPNYPALMTADAEPFFDWLKATPQQAIIGVAIHRSAIDYQQQQVGDALINGIEAKGHRAFAFFYDDQDKKHSYPELLLDQAQQPRLQLIINYRSLHYVAKRRAEFEKVAVPVIHALNYISGDSEKFELANTGISPGLTPFFVVLPEDSGTIDPTIIAATVDGKKVVMPAQLNALVDRAIKHAKLAITANADKKVAAFIWNYPPGEKNIGAAFLDVPSSLEQIAIAMKQAGYQIELKTSQQIIEAAGQLLRPYYRNEDARGLLTTNLAATLPLATYLNWFEALPEQVQQQINQRWGTAQENPMVTEVNGEQVFIIPRMELGNLIVLPQGGRSNSAKDHANLYHDMKTPVNHGYLAIYLYARAQFNADAFIHLGTHGSQEWLLGKERGLSVNDSPNLAIGNVPTFYPYIIDNVGEAMQAKRRGRATMISHLTPGFAKAGLYSDIAKLNELITNYLLLDQGQTQTNTQTSIETLAEELNLLQDLALTKQQFHQDFANNLATLQDQLNEMAQQAQPLGVHTFGLLPKEQHLYTTMLQMLGDDFTQAAKLYEDQQGLTLPESERVDRLNVTKLTALAGFQLLQAHITGQSLPDLPATLAAHLITAQLYWDNFADIAEIKHLLAAMSANFIPVGYGGDPIRNPQAVPTGRNLIGLTPPKYHRKKPIRLV